MGVNVPVGPTGTIRVQGDVWAGYSDARLKTDITLIENCLRKVMNMTGIHFTSNHLAKEYGYNTTEKHVGLIAQQVQLFAPEIVALAPFDIDENGNSKSGHNFLSVKYDKLIPILLEAIKEQQKELAELQQILDNR
jgi:hypothetical protein